MKTFFFRLLSSAFLIALFYWILFSNTYLTWLIFSILAVLISIISTLEFHNFFASKIKSFKAKRFIALLLSALIVIYILYAVKIGIPFLNTLFLIILVLLIVFALNLIFTRNNFEGFISSILIYVPIVIFIIPLIHLIPLYHLDRSSNLFSVAFLILVTKSGDIGAYIFGMLTAKYMKGGNHKMIPSVSPKKSWEGFFSGLTISIVVSYFCKNFLGEMISAGEILCVAFILYIVGVCGDLFESSIKRVADIKDSGSLIPGIGGILDLIDSLVLNAPLFYFYLQLKGIIK